MSDDDVELMVDGRPLYYVLDENDNPVAWTGTLIAWADWFKDHDQRRIFKETVVRGVRVITAFLGMDDAAATLRPCEFPAVFGTLVTGMDEYFDGTKADALARHDRIVEKLEKGEQLDDEDDLDLLSRTAKRLLWNSRNPDQSEH